ncbi:MAG: SDR family oxidoreductase, partial [Nitrospinota bacterium]|nr:SDR family oxidoreductase [Nitrospinota bacterium]
KGIGFAITEVLATSGAKVVICNRNEEEGIGSAKKIKEKGFDVDFKSMDLSIPSSIKETIQNVNSENGKIDAVINSAGHLIVKPAIEYGVEDIDELLQINLRGALVLAQEAAKVMIPNKGGKLVFVSSILAERAVPNQAAYIATKGGIAALTKALSIEWAKYNIQVNAIAPQLTRTPMTEGLFSDPDKMKSVIERTPAGRAGEPSDVAGLAKFLCSSQSDYLTGQHICVDGGRSASG